MINLKKYAIQSGKSLKEVEEQYNIALMEVKNLGIDLNSHMPPGCELDNNNDYFVESTLKVLLEIDTDEAIQNTTKRIVKEFLNSDETVFSEFIHKKINEITMTPTNSVGYMGNTPSENPIAVVTFPPNTVKKIKKDKDDDDKDNDDGIITVKTPQDLAGKIDVGVLGIDDLPDTDEEKEAKKMGLDYKTKTVSQILSPST